MGFAGRDIDDMFHYMCYFEKGGVISALHRMTKKGFLSSNWFSQSGAGGVSAILLGTGAFVIGNLLVGVVCHLAI